MGQLNRAFSRGVAASGTPELLASCAPRLREFTASATLPRCPRVQAGGFVADGRVNGSLNLSRALGDLEYKQNRDLPPEEQVCNRGWAWVVSGSDSR